jgi:sugar phosphate permease
LRNETQLVLLAAIGALVYGAVLLASLKVLGVRFRPRQA